jgi:uncharacterized protein DUF3606
MTNHLRRQAAEPVRVYIRDEDQVRHWAEKWGMSEERLKEAVEDAGPCVARLARQLGKPRD